MLVYNIPFNIANNEWHNCKISISKNLVWFQLSQKINKTSMKTMLNVNIILLADMTWLFFYLYYKIIVLKENKYCT